MALRRDEKSYFTFIKGLNTEASPFTFPEHTSSDESNFVLNVDGSRKRRLGIDYESSHSLFSHTTASTDVITVHEWRNAAGNSSYNFIVVQIGSTLYFYTNQDALSANKKSFSVNLLTFKVSGTADNNVKQNPIDSDYGKGYLFIAGKYIEPIYISYDPTGDTITTATITVKERNFERLTDVDATVSPATLTAAHSYNLLNQGWTNTFIDRYFTAFGNYPPNNRIMADMWYVDPTTGQRTYNLQQTETYEHGNTAAPNGNIIHNVFNTNDISNVTNAFTISTWTYNHATTTVTITTSLAHGLTAGQVISISENEFTYNDGVGTVASTLNGTYAIATVPTSTTLTITKTITNFTAFVSQFVSKGSVNIYSMSHPSPTAEVVRFTTVAFFAGRVFWAGAPTQRLNGKIFFTQLLETASNIGYCYQAASPVSAEDSELVDTDGGVVTIPEIGQIYKMKPIGTQLAIYADNGVWLIGGGEDNYFKATSYTVRNSSNAQVISPRAVVDVEGKPLFWAKQGIYNLQEDKVSGFLSGVSLSDATIQSYFNTIPEANLSGVSGAYDDIFKRVIWTYSTGANKYKHDKCLILDLRLGAFYRFSIPASNPYVAACVPLLSVDVAVQAKKIKLFTVVTGTNKITWSDFNNTSWKDWYTFDTTGTDAAAYMLTGHEVNGDAIRKKEIPYLFLFMKRTETQWISAGGMSATLSPASGVQVRIRWDFNGTSTGGKFSPVFQGYRHNRNHIAPDVLPATFDPGYDVIITKNKIRGIGRAFQVYFATESGKDCHIYGWTTTLNSGTEA